MTVKRLILLFVCGAFFSTLVYAKSNNRFVKNVLQNERAMQKLSEIAKVPRLLANSKTLGALIGSAAIAGVLLATPIDVEASANKKAEAIDKKVREVKVVERATELQWAHSAKAHGSFFNSNSKADSFTAGIGYEGQLHHGYNELDISASFGSNNTKADGESDWEGSEDYLGRLIYTRGIPIGSEHLMPIVYAEGGGGRYGNNRQAADFTLGVGLGISGELFSKPISLRLRVGAGAQGEGLYRDGDYEDIELGSTSIFAATLHTKWTSLGDVLAADSSSPLHYVPVIFGGVTEYAQYNPLGEGDFGDSTRRLKITADLHKYLSFEYNRLSSAAEGVDAAQSFALAAKYTVF